MSYETYRILHVVGLILLFLGLGGLLMAPVEKRPKLGFVLHGLGLLVMLVAGFGIHARKSLAWDNWLYVKIACWLLVAVLPVLVSKSVLPRWLGWLVAIAAGVTAAWLGLAIVKPF